MIFFHLEKWMVNLSYFDENSALIGYIEIGLSSVWFTNMIRIIIDKFDEWMYQKPVTSFKGLNNAYIRHVCLKS